MEGEILTYEEMKKLLNISSNRLSRLTKKGLPYVSLGGETRIFLKSSVLQWLKNREK
jgi:hypothetical protein